MISRLSPRLPLPLLAPLAIWLWSWGSLQSAEPSARVLQFDAEIKPLMQQLCFRCHEEGATESDRRLDTLVADVQHESFDVSTWHDALDQIKQGEMPPEKAEPLTDVQRQTLVAWISATLDEAAQTKRYADGRVLMRRLTRYEYANTIRDLLGVDLDLSADLPPEPASPDGFLNNGATLEMSSTQIETYLAAARRALEIAIVSGDRPPVYRYYATETAVGKLPRRAEGGNVPVNPEFLLDIPEFPRTGPFRILIRAGAMVPEGEGFPQLKVSLGNVPGIIHVPRKQVGAAEITAPSHQPQTFEFQGRMEDYPQPGERPFGANVDFNGMIGLIDFVDAEGQELRYADRTYSDPPQQAKGNKKPDPKFKGRLGREVAGPGPRYDVAIHSVELEAPFYPAWPPPSHQRIMRVSGKAKTEAQQATEILTRFMPLAFRRPLHKQELQPTLELFQAMRPKMESFEDAMRETLASVLVSPHFLYIVEERTPHGDAAGNQAVPQAVPVQALSPHELATRLSYFLWSTMPDQELRAHAANGTLAEPDRLRGEVQRMLDDPKSAELFDHLADQWFDLEMLQRVAVNPEFYPQFDEDLKHSMRGETRGYLREIVLHNRSGLELLDSNWTMANRALAKHYQLAEVPRTAEMQRIELTPDDRRGGILAHGSFLLSGSDGQRPHPIRRAVWILDRLLDSPPASPPPDVPDLDANNADTSKLTLKQQLERHRQQESCRSCHAGIDPWGIPLEHFDAVGVWTETSPVRVARRKKDGPSPSGPEVDATAKLPDGQSVNGLADLKQVLAEQKRDAFARSVVKRLVSYSLGRSIDIADRKAIDSLTADFVADNFRMRDLITRLVLSDLFRSK